MRLSSLHNRLFRHLLLPGALLLGLCGSVQAGQLPGQVARALEAGKLPSSAMSLAVIPLDGQGVAQFVNADTPVNPASTMKLVTTYAALELLGPTWQWNTDLLASGPIENGVLKGDLVFRSSGDPKLTRERIWTLLRDLRASGVRQVTGDLVLQPADLRLPTDIAEFVDDGNDPSRPFLVTPDPLLSNLKVFQLRTFGESTGVRTHLEPPLPEVRVVSEVKLLPAARSCPWPNIHYALSDQGSQATLTLRGEIHEGCQAERWLSALDHATYTGSLLRTTWEELGGSIAGTIRIGSMPSDARLLARTTSPDLVDTIRDINKFSNNTMTRQLLLNIGRQQRSAADADDHKAAVRVINQWLAAKGIASEHLVIENGSGLSRFERLTARDLALMLEQAARSPYAAEFTASMPLAAMDGTMRRRLRNTPVAGQAHIKTGALRDVRALAGISRDRNGQKWAVVAIVNHPAAGNSRNALDLVITDVHQRASSQVALGN